MCRLGLPLRPRCCSQCTDPATKVRSCNRCCRHCWRHCCCCCRRCSGASSAYRACTMWLHIAACAWRAQLPQLPAQLLSLLTVPLLLLLSTQQRLRLRHPPGAQQQMTWRHLILAQLPRWQLPTQLTIAQRGWACRSRWVWAGPALVGLQATLWAAHCRPHCCCPRNVYSTWHRCRRQ